MNVLDDRDNTARRSAKINRRPVRLDHKLFGVVRLYMQLLICLPFDAGKSFDRIKSINNELTGPLNIYGRQTAECTRLAQ